jgi:hypothetical protein
MFDPLWSLFRALIISSKGDYGTGSWGTSGAGLARLTEIVWLAPATVFVFPLFYLFVFCFEASNPAAGWET